MIKPLCDRRHFSGCFALLLAVLGVAVAGCGSDSPPDDHNAGRASDGSAASSVSTSSQSKRAPDRAGGESGSGTSEKEFSEAGEAANAGGTPKPSATEGNDHDQRTPSPAQGGSGRDLHPAAPAKPSTAAQGGSKGENENRAPTPSAKPAPEDTSTPQGHPAG